MERLSQRRQASPDQTKGPSWSWWGDLTERDGANETLIWACGGATCDGGYPIVSWLEPDTGAV